MLDWTPGAAAETAKRIEKLGRRALAFEGDAGDEKTVVDAFAATQQKLGPVDVAVACAGVLGEGGPVFETPLADFERVMGVNVRGSFLLVREAARQMRPRRSGAIVLLSSLDGLQAEHGMFSYCTSKGALLNLARAAALDLARDQVTVNCVCPSVTRTPLLEGRLATIPNGEEVLRSYAERHPLGPGADPARHRLGHRLRRLAARDRHHRRGAAGGRRHRGDLGQLPRPALGRPCVMNALRAAPRCRRPRDGRSR